MPITHAIPHALSLILTELKRWVERSPGTRKKFVVSKQIDRHLNKDGTVAEGFFSGARALLLQVADSEPGDDPELAKSIVALLARFEVTARFVDPTTD